MPVTALLAARSVLCRVGATGVCIWVSLGATPARAGDGDLPALAQREIARREAASQRASEFMAEGQSARQRKDLAAAVEAYQKALNELPKAPATDALRSQALQAYAETGTARAEELATLARYDEANRLLDDILREDRLPGYVPARRLRQQIQDPEYFNPAATPGHLEDVQNVTEQLTLADGHFALGNFDQARDHYNRALAIDRTNTAARRGLERVERRVIDHHAASRDHTRAAALREVDQMWETPAPRAGAEFAAGGVDRGGTPLGAATAREKIGSIILPQVQLVDATLDEVVQFLALQSKNHDLRETDPARKGVNIVLGGDATLASKRVTLNLSDVPLGYVLETAAKMAGTQMRVEDFLVVIGPVGGSQMITQKFRVPPGFFSTSPVAATGGADPFATSDTPGGEAGAGGGLAFARISPEDFFKQNGATFTDGAAAFFSPVTGELTVRNTPANLDLIRQLIEDASSSVPKMVQIRTTMLEVNQETIEELGFDWLLGQFNVGGGGVFAGGGTHGNQPGGDDQALSQNFPFVPPGGGQSPVGTNPLTAGNRSGNSATPPNSIDALLQGQGGANPGIKAPAMFGVSGVLTDPQFQVVIRGLNQHKGVDVSSSPEVVTKSGQRAKVEVIREFIYPTEFEPPEIPQDIGGGNALLPIDLGGGAIGILPVQLGFDGGAFPVTPTTPTAFETAKLGTILEVEATVGADNRTIELDVAPAFKEFEGFINYGTPITTIEGNQRIVLTENRIPQPVFRANQASGLNVTLWSGSTMVIAGLAGEERISVEDKTPIFGDLPYVGRFFRSKADAVRRKVIVFMVTAKVVDPSGDEPPAVVGAVEN